MSTDLPHDLVVLETGIQARYIRLTVESLPYGQAACVSGLRVFGLGHGEPPLQADRVTASMTPALRKAKRSKLFNK